MKNFKFRKPFSTFSTDPNYYLSTTLKERWIDAFHDPGYLLIVGLTLFMFCALIFLV